MNIYLYLSTYFHNYTQTWSLTFPVLANVQNIFNKWPEVLLKFMNEVDPINVSIPISYLKTFDHCLKD